MSPILAGWPPWLISIKTRPSYITHRTTPLKSIMKPSTLLSTLASTAVIVPMAQATWCNFYYDSACTNDANGGTSFDCANDNVFGSGGGYIKCHSTPANKQTCHATRCTCPEAGQCKPTFCGGGTETNIPADSKCYSMDGAGPWYYLSFA